MCRISKVEPGLPRLTWGHYEKTSDQRKLNDLSLLAYCFLHTWDVVFQFLLHIYWTSRVVITRKVDGNILLHAHLPNIKSRFRGFLQGSISDNKNARSLVERGWLTSNSPEGHKITLLCYHRFYMCVVGIFFISCDLCCRVLAQVTWQ